jgi:hypothetical protein
MAMAVHAAGETGPAEVGTHAVVLSVPNEQALKNLASALEARGHVHHCVHEPWAPWDGAMMAIGLPPGPKCKVLSNLKLFNPKEQDDDD